MDRPGKKLLVYFCTDRNPIFLKINTISYNKRNEVLLQTDKYSELDHVSYLDCQTVITSVREQEVIKQIKADAKILRGQLLDEDLKQVKVIVNQMRVISPRVKELISNAISEILEDEIDY
jgi:hypothetical protein